MVLRPPTTTTQRLTRQRPSALREHPEVFTFALGDRRIEKGLLHASPSTMHGDVVHGQVDPAMSMRPCALGTARFSWTVRASVDGSHRPAAPCRRGDRPVCHRRCGVDRSVAGSPGRSLLVDEGLPPAVRGGSGGPFGGRLAKCRDDGARGAIIAPDMARLRRPTPLALRLQLRNHLLQGNAVRGRGLTGGRQGVLQVIACLHFFE
jgi:hypothetical protein